MIRQLTAIQEELNLEKILWSVIKNKEFSGARFMRQYNIGKYNVDFYCPSLKLAIELDAENYNSENKYDMEREKFIISKGIKILRLNNNELKNALVDFVNKIIKN